jgi:hypothetical protein
MSGSQSSTPGRRLRNVVEPLAANVYFAPEAQEAYTAIGLSSYPESYFSSRGGCLGQVPGEVIASAFGVFYPPMVAGFVAAAWEKVDVETLLDARRRGATAALERILSGKPDGLERATELLQRAAEAGTVAGHPLYAGLLALEWPGDPIGDFWRAADLVREHRGDGHTCAWVAHGLTAPEVLLLTEAWWGLALHSYSRTRAWPQHEMEATMASLRDRGLLDGEQLTPAGEELRESIEAMTDATERSVLDALGDDVDELTELLRPWAKAVVDTGGYPTDPASLSRSVPKS